MKNLFLILLALIALVFGSVTANAMCVYNSGPPRQCPGTDEFFQGVFVAFDCGFFCGNKWNVTFNLKAFPNDLNKVSKFFSNNLEKKLEWYYCRTGESGLACASLTEELSDSGAFNCCHVEAHGCVFVNKDYPVKCVDPGEPFGGFRDCPSIECLTNAQCNEEFR